MLTSLDDPRYYNDDDQRIDQNRKYDREMSPLLQAINPARNKIVQGNSIFNNPLHKYALKESSGWPGLGGGVFENFSRNPSITRAAGRMPGSIGMYTII